jgi:hypothetical protein
MQDEVMLDEWTEGKLDYQRDSVLLVVEDIDNAMVITHTKLDAEDVWQLLVFMADKLSKYTGLPYNEVIENLKEIEGES